MRTFAITQNITVDGRIEMLGDWFNPGDQDEDLAAELMRQSADEDVLLLGRQTFEDMRGYWPHQTDDRSGVHAQLERVHKVVVSSTLSDPDWGHTTVLRADWRERLAAMKAEGGGDIVLTGSVSLCPDVLATGLVDELRLIVYPVVQGRGARLLPDGFETSLRLTDSRTFGRGVALLRYAMD
jgi:dihydrofolate reductase